MNGLARKREGGKYSANDDEREAEVEGENPSVKREEYGTDELRAEGKRTFVVCVAGGDLKRIAAALEDLQLFGFGQRAAQFRLLVVHFRLNVFGQLAEDIFALAGREELREKAEVAFKRSHGITLSQFR